MHHPTERITHTTDRITHTTAFVTPVMEHWLERKICSAETTYMTLKINRNHFQESLLPIVRPVIFYFNRNKIRQVELPCHRTPWFDSMLCGPVVHLWGFRRCRSEYVEGFPAIKTAFNTMCTSTKNRQPLFVKLHLIRLLTVIQIRIPCHDLTDLIWIEFDSSDFKNSSLVLGFC